MYYAKKSLNLTITLDTRSSSSMLKDDLLVLQLLITFSESLAFTAITPAFTPTCSIVL
ncbi:MULTISPECIES: hypothetical protein [unclassified Clostridium]|uniref:hypothetical protein n=1 Tax=unclassified Clostridium TaxID=2614128 RepID=UPI0020792A3D|nr:MULTISPECIES: hypothetical protein [unclassified Clostridium]